MKTRMMALPLFFLAGLLVSSCTTLDRLNTEHEEETTRVAQMTSQEKADWDNEQHVNSLSHPGGNITGLSQSSAVI